MYKLIDKLQHPFLDFNQPMGLHMNPDNHRIKMTGRIPWNKFEIKHARLFLSGTGKYPLSLGCFISERSKGKTGNNYLPFL